MASRSGVGWYRNQGFYKPIAKVSDLGLAMKFNDSMAYKKTNHNYVPSEWTAPEFIETGFTSASDVWSFGVLIWEMFSLGRKPYAGATDHDFAAKLQSGYSLPFPEELNQVNNFLDIFYDTN